MEDYIYKETKYIKRKDLNDFEDLMSKYDFMPEEIQDKNEYKIVFRYLVNLTEKAPDFILPYEFALSMLEGLEPSVELITLESDLDRRRLEACERVANKDKIFNKIVEWGWLENRPLIRDCLIKRTCFGNLAK